MLSTILSFASDHWVALSGGLAAHIAGWFGPGIKDKLVTKEKAAVSAWQGK